ncbi:hypothetical protein X801_08030 [Opisthorchis viverrini]|uniref:Uncharacterized protein n=1 Tax=Opisthorchis viverrini TaxID=6198 RepID=A0A1S8WNT6_OPIVI|nr:hypothetical protein X801_08030 [Opisthorchis viverrini]
MPKNAYLKTIQKIKFMEKTWLLVMEESLSVGSKALRRRQKTCWKMRISTRPRE